MEELVSWEMTKFGPDRISERLEGARPGRDGPNGRGGASKQTSGKAKENWKEVKIDGVWIITPRNREND